MREKLFSLIVVVNETNYCGCDFACACPTYYKAVQGFYTKADAADFLACLIQRDEYSNISDMFLNGMPLILDEPVSKIGKKKNFLVKYRSNVLFHEIKNTTLKDGMYIVLNSLLDELEKVLKPYFEEYNKSVMTEEEKKEAEEIAELNRLRVKYPNA